MNDVLTQWSARRLARAISSRDVSAAEVVSAHVAVIERVNPTLNALTVVFSERAAAAASALDEAIATGVVLPPLAGVPFSVKENIDLTWSPTTHGWRGAATEQPAVDATIVRRMRDAGAIPIGRGNMPDFGMRWDTDNDLFGRTLNPWDHGRSPGGSSGGDAVSVATGMSAIGLGNDFGGSLRLPAYAVGICGLRPSRGSLPRAAVRGIPVSMTLQQFAVNGVLARTVDDAQLAHALLRGADPDDPVSLPVFASDESASPRRIGVSRDPLGWGIDPDVAAGIDRAASALAGAGWELVDVELPRLEEAAVTWRRLACTDMQFSLDPAQLSQPLGVSATRFLRDGLTAARPFDTVREYADAWARCAVIAADWQRLQADIPVILGPVSTARMGAPDDDLGGPDAATRAWRDLRLTVAVNLLGLPSIALPTGLGTDAMPTGVQLIGPMHREDVMFAAARDVEAALGQIPLGTLRG